MIPVFLFCIQIVHEKHKISKNICKPRAAFTCSTLSPMLSIYYLL